MPDLLLISGGSYFEFASRGSIYYNAGIKFRVDIAIFVSHCMLQSLMFNKGTLCSKKLGKWMLVHCSQR